MEHKILKRKFKNVRAYTGIMEMVMWGGGSGIGSLVRKLYYVCSCGKTVAATNWKNHIKNK